MHPSYLRISDYTYDLPSARIAQFPLKHRDLSKLLVYNASSGELHENVFKNLATELPDECLLLFNETRVVHARLHFKKASGGQIEIFCLSPHDPVKEVEQAFAQLSPVTWKVYIGNAKRWKTGLVALEFEHQGVKAMLNAQQVARLDDGFLVEFSWEPVNLTFGTILELAGNVPLPPYIQRETVLEDQEAYQTIYARTNGSVAAPTAGLHFTNEIFESLKYKNIQTAGVILHVGAGTFKPVESETIGNHQMHTEEISVPMDVIQKLLAYTGKPRIVVGTTTARTLESLYWAGVKVLTGHAAHSAVIEQWDPYSGDYPVNIPAADSLAALCLHLEKQGVDAYNGYTSLLIAPGYNFRMTDALITNFHQPGSTLLLLVSALIGNNWRQVYDYALDQGFRFLSYGDACLFFGDTGKTI